MNEVGLRLLPLLLLAVALPGRLALAAGSGGSGSGGGAAGGQVVAPEEKIAEIVRLLAPLTAQDLVSASLPARASATARRVEAFRLWKSLPAERQAPLRVLFDPPAGPTCLTSEHYPIRSCYDAPGQLALAQAILGYAETAWQREVDDLGFLPPKRPAADGTPETGIVLSLGDTISMGADGYTSPIDFDQSTPYTDCMSYIVVNQEDVPGEQTATTVYHEFNHTCQMAMDCLETATSMEATATWAEQVVEGHPSQYFQAAIGEFQNQPESSLGNFQRNSLYPYGVSLFIQFVQEYLGGNDPHAIAQLWHGTMQEIEENEPDLLDAIEALAVQQGKTLPELLLEFAQWRWFLGANDDGHHFQDGALWRGAELRTTDRLALPGLTLPASRPVTIQRLGYHFARFDFGVDWLTGGKLLLSLSGTSAQRGYLELWLFKNGAIDQRLTTFGLAEGQPPRLVVDGAVLADADRAVLLFADFRGAVEWDDRWNDQNLAYDVAALEQPAVTAVQPGQLIVGQQAEITVSGTGFSAATRIEMEYAGLTLDQVRAVDATKLTAQATVAADAVPGAVDVKVANVVADLRLDAVLAGGLQIVLPAAPVPQSLHPDRGAPGDQLLVRLEGTGLAQDLTVGFSCPEVTVDRQSWVDAQTAYLHLTLAPTAGATACDLQVTDHFGQQAVLPAAFHVVPPQPADEDAGAGADAGTGDDAGTGAADAGSPPLEQGTSKGDSGCALAKGPAAGVGALLPGLLLVLAGLVLRRRNAG